MPRHETGTISILLRAAFALALMFAGGVIPAAAAHAQDFPLFVADYRGIGVYSLDAAGSNTVHGFVAGPLNSVRNDEDGNLYTCTESSGDVSKIDSSANVTVYATGFAGCFGLLFAEDGTLYVSNFPAGRIEVVPPGGGPFTTLASGLGGPMHMAFDADGSLLVAEFVAGQVSRVDAGGSVSVVAAGLDRPVGVAVGPDDSIYVSELFSGRLVRIDWAGAASLLADRGDDAGPTGLEFHRDGRLFVAELFAGRITTADIATGDVAVFRDGLVAPVGLSFLRRTEQPPLVLGVRVDLKPGNKENSVNPRSHGVVPVAILGSGAFEVASVDPSTVRFGATGIEAAAVHSHVEDVNGDGWLDLMLHFSTQALGIPAGLPKGSLVPLKLTGKTLAGQEIEGEDVVKTVQ